MPIKNKKQHGFAMIEVLVTAVIFAIGISGMGVLLLKTIQGTQDNAQRSQGMWIVQDFIGRIRANPNGAKNNGYIIAGNPNCNAPPANICADHIQNGNKVNAVACDSAPAPGAEGIQMATFDIWVTMCGFDSPPTPSDNIFDSPAEFLINPELTSSCDLAAGGECFQYTVNLKWDSRLAKGGVNAVDRIKENNFSMVVELN